MNATTTPTTIRGLSAALMAAEARCTEAGASLVEATTHLRQVSQLWQSAEDAAALERGRRIDAEDDLRDAVAARAAATKTLKEQGGESRRLGQMLNEVLAHRYMLALYVEQLEAEKVTAINASSAADEEQRRQATPKTAATFPEALGGYLNRDLEAWLRQEPMTDLDRVTFQYLFGTAITSPTPEAQ